MGLPCKNFYLCKDFNKPLSHLYCHSCDLCFKTGKWPRASAVQNVYVYMLSTYSCMVWVLQLIFIYVFIYLFIMEEELTVLSTKFWNVRNGRVWMTEATISNTHKHNEGEHCAGFYSLQCPNCTRAADQWVTIHGGEWNKYQIRYHTSAYCLYLFSLPSSVFLHPFLFTPFYPLELPLIGW